MPNSQRLENAIDEAKGKEKAFAWLKAAELYEHALGIVEKTSLLRKGEVQEKVGFCLYKAAFQAESQREFRQRLRQAAGIYRKAAKFYENLNDVRKRPRMLRCEAMTAYVGYWLASEASEKKRLINDCWRLAKEALITFEDAGDALEYGRTYNQLSTSAYGGYVFEWIFQAREKTIEEATEFGEKSISLLSGAGDAHELAKAYVKIAHYLAIVDFYFDSDMDEKEKHHKKALEYWHEAVKLSEETAFLELLSMSGEGLAWSFDEMLMNYGKALEYAKKTGDKFQIGTALDWLAYATFWKSMESEDLDKRKQVYQKALCYATATRRHFSPISFVSPRSAACWTGAPNAEYCNTLAVLETDLTKKHCLLEKAIVDGTNTLKQAESLEYPEIILYVHSVLASSLLYLAKIETKLEEKKKLLESGLEHRKESMKLANELARFSYFSLGMFWNSLGAYKAELSDVETDSENRKNMLEEAILCREQGIQLCIKHISYLEKKGDLSLFASLGYAQYLCGLLLNNFYGLSHNNEHQRRAIRTFEEASKSYQKVNLVSRMAECQWKAARSRDSLSEHLEAAENFHMASEFFNGAAEKLPQLKNLYKDNALYMQAWSEIEKARHHHWRQEYGLAMEHFEKAAGLHASSAQWKYLASNYSAWAQVEKAEHLSREEQTEEAIEAFTLATELFNETESSLQAEVGKIDSADEKNMTTNLIKSAGVRREYCAGRIALEEAKILDKSGDHYSSSQKYGMAAEKFEKIRKDLGSEKESKEFKLITILSRAWEKMTRAESEASPTLYAEASQLFEEAKDFGQGDRVKMLMLGHSRFCKALEAGTKFADTRESIMYVEATKLLGSAANYYMKADFRNASEYTKATKLLFDAYLYMDNAEKEGAPDEKAKLYAVAEKVLQTSAGSFMKAEHPEKEEQVLRLLEKVKEEQKLALSLSELLHAPSLVSTTTTFATPAPTQESAVGLDEFENANIQANLILKLREVKVEDDVDFRIELVNAGKAPALLIKVDEVMPHGFKIKKAPETCTVEDNHLNLKGRMLKPLGTDDLRIVAKPQLKGIHTIKPRILYIDETGKYKYHEPEPVTITVKELGIRGWLKGET